MKCYYNRAINKILLKSKCTFITKTSYPLNANGNQQIILIKLIHTLFVIVNDRGIHITFQCFSIIYKLIRIVLVISIYIYGKSIFSID